MAHAYVVFGHGRYIWMLQTDVPLVLTGIAVLPNVGLSTFAGHAVYARILEFQVA
jgi:hypothetical protein